MFLLLVALCCCCGGGVVALGGVVRISDAEGLKGFSDNVNNGGTSYSGITVYLDADIDLSGVEFEPIGIDDKSNHFNGTFDGQGHVIYNLKMNSSSAYIGLFGYSLSGTLCLTSPALSRVHMSLLNLLALLM